MSTPTSPGATPDLYTVLGVDRNADGIQLRRAYRRRALALHPDRNPDPDATARFRAVAEAYAVLSDPLQRAAYDTAHTAPGPDRGEPCPGPGPSRPDPPSSPAAGPEPTSSAAAYTPVAEPVAHTDYAPTSGYAPPPPPPARPASPPTGGHAQDRAQSELLPTGWPVGHIDHHRLAVLSGHVGDSPARDR
jgi:curved DNA-binding protein CbpA